MSQDVPTIQSSMAEVWYLKEIKFRQKRIRIITQNFNGPCSFIAICNILILRGNITIEPPSRKTVSYEFLSQLVAEFLLMSSPDVDVSAALSIMPHTQKGMDLNPVFTSPTAFRPATTGGELKLFEQVGITLVHGWLLDPESPEASMLGRVKDYDAAVGLIAEVDHMTEGRFVVDEDALANDNDRAAGGARSPTKNWTKEDRGKIDDAIKTRHFLSATQAQLTYHGLFQLASTIPPDSLMALFRNSHLSVVYKSPDPSFLSVPSKPSSSPPPSSSSDPSPPLASPPISPPPPTDPSPSALYTLCTDQVFLHEPSIVWERLEDIDGGWSTFVDSDFVRATPVGGDFAGETAETVLREWEREMGGQGQGGNDPDLALARQLQAEEQYRARREDEAWAREQERRRQEQREAQAGAMRPSQQGGKPGKEGKEDKDKKKSDCVIM